MNAASLSVLLVIQLCASLPFDDPSTWPGHLESYGSKQKTVPINEYYQWPNPKDFFKNFVDKSLPTLFRGVYRNSKAIHLWNDEYFLGHEDSDKIAVSARHLKENRTGVMMQMNLKKFIESYHERPILMSGSVPVQFKKDLLLPSPLICNETRKYLYETAEKFSQGESRSVIYIDDADTLLCAIQGVTQVLLIEYTHNKNYVIDKPEFGYSTVDVDKVDYTKYPNLRRIDQYHKSTVREGDCLFIPFRWYKQMRGFSNRYHQNIAAHFRFKHLHDHKPVTCEMSPDDATLDKFEFGDEDAWSFSNDTEVKEVQHEQNMEVESQDYGKRFFKHFYRYFKVLKKKEITFDEFSSHIKTDEELTNQDHSNLKFPETFNVLAIELFQKLDLNNDTRMEIGEFKNIVKNRTMYKKYCSYLNYQVARIEDYVEDLMEANHHDEPIHKFEERIKEKWQFERKFDEL